MHVHSIDGLQRQETHLAMKILARSVVDAESQLAHCLGGTFATTTGYLSVKAAEKDKIKMQQRQIKNYLLSHRPRKSGTSTLTREAIIALASLPKSVSDDRSALPRLNA